MARSTRRATILFFHILGGWTDLAARLVPANFFRMIYGRPLLSGIIRRMLNLMAPQGFTEVRVASGALKGVRLNLDLRSEKSYWLGTYEPAITDCIKNFAKPGMVAYDVGANIGYLTLLLAQTVGPTGRIFAFEPLPMNIKRIKEHVRLNSLQDRVVVSPCAISDKDGRQTMLIHESHAMGRLDGAFGRALPYQSRLEVPTLTLDTFVSDTKNPPPDIIKIDIEGGAAKAFPGMECLLEKHKPIILMELHGPEEAAAAWASLAQHEYKVHRVAPGYPEISQRESLDWKDHIIAMPAGFAC